MYCKGCSILNGVKPNHRLNIRYYSDRCEKYFHSNDCTFEQNLQISILEKVKGPDAKRQCKEDNTVVNTIRCIIPKGFKCSKI